MRAAQDAFRASAPSKGCLAPWNAHCSEMVRTAMPIFTKRDSSLKAADCYPMDKCGERISRPPPMRFGKGTRVGVFSFLATNCRRGCFPQTPSCVGFFKDPSGDQHFGFFGEKIESTVICA